MAHRVHKHLYTFPLDVDIIDRKYKAQHFSFNDNAENTVAVIVVLWKEHTKHIQEFTSSRLSSLVCWPQGQGLQGQRVLEPGGVERNARKILTRQPVFVVDPGYEGNETGKGTAGILSFVRAQIIQDASNEKGIIHHRQNDITSNRWLWKRKNFNQISSIFLDVKKNHCLNNYSSSALNYDEIRCVNSFHVYSHNFA